MLIKTRLGNAGTGFYVEGQPLSAGRGRADCCSAAAWVRVFVRGLPLDFCAHHYMEHEAALDRCQYPVDDQRCELLESSSQAVARLRAGQCDGSCPAGLHRSGTNEVNSE